MFCNRCGKELQPEYLVCPYCEQRLVNPAGAAGQSRLERHLQTLGILWTTIGGLFLIPAVGLMVFGRGMHVVLHNREPWPGFFQLLVLVASGSLMILAAGGVCVGLGLMQHRAWARVTAIILGVLALFHPPFGTALGAYTLWILLADDRGEEYRYLARTG
jgi:hypothetical protein